MNLKLASEKLKVGEVYSRKSLREIFPTSDATLNTGVFRPKNYSSVWLFVTRKKHRTSQSTSITYLERHFTGRDKPQAKAIRRSLSIKTAIWSCSFSIEKSPSNTPTQDFATSVRSNT